MAEVTNHLMYELPKGVDLGMSELRMDVAEVKREVNVIRGHIVAVQTDTHDIHGILGRHYDCLQRIERRLDLRELAEPQCPFDPST